MITLAEALVMHGLAIDKSVAKRLIVQGAIKVDGEQVCDIGRELSSRGNHAISVVGHHNEEEVVIGRN